MNRALLRFLDTARHRPLSDDEFETMKSLAVLDMLCGYWERAVEPCARCGVARDLHGEWRAWVDDPVGVAAHSFVSTAAPAPVGDLLLPGPPPVTAGEPAAPSPLAAWRAGTVSGGVGAANRPWPASITSAPARPVAEEDRPSAWRRFVRRLGIGGARPANQS